MKYKKKRLKIMVSTAVFVSILSISLYQKVKENQKQGENFRQNSSEIPKYYRKDYKHWIDADDDCQDTRQEVLIAESLEKVVLSQDGCKVVSGKWYDFYTDRYFEDPKQLDIDHFVPLFEAHQSGAHAWNKYKKQDFANDLQDPKTLIAVYRGANRSKGAKDPSQWLPANEKYICQYLKTWLEIKQKWHLQMDEKEKLAIEEGVSGC